MASSNMAKESILYMFMLDNMPGSGLILFAKRLIIYNDHIKCFFLSLLPLKISQIRHYTNPRSDTPFPNFSNYMFYSPE